MNADSLFRWINRNDNFIVSTTGLLGISIATILKNTGFLDSTLETIALMVIAIGSLVTTFVVGIDFYSPSFFTKAVSILAPATCIVVSAIGLIPLISWNTAVGICILLYSIECWILRPLEVVHEPSFEMSDDLD